MSAGRFSTRDEVVSLDLDIGRCELGVAECRELVRCLDRLGRRPDGGAAFASARRLEALLDERLPVGGIAEDELDAIANAAWDWLRRVGSDAFPERVLVVLDVLRARHAHE